MCKIIPIVKRVFTFIFSLILSIHKKTRFTKAERELQAARPFGYAPRKFYESSHLVKPEKKDAKGAPEPATVAPETPKVDKEAEKTTKRLYVAITSDRGNFLCIAMVGTCDIL